MSKIVADETKQIPVESWEAWCEEFTSGNRGRLIGIELVGDGVGAEPLAEQIALVAIDHDPADKGNDMVVSYGAEGAPYRHIIEGPIALWQGQDKNGKVVALEIEQAGGNHTIITVE